MLERDPWDVDSWSSGLLDDFDFTITKSTFGYRDVYHGGEALLLIWEGDSPDGEVGEILTSVGDGWESAKGGAEATHPSLKVFGKRTWIWHIVKRVTKDLRFDMSSRGSPAQAKVWEGLSFHMRREKVDFGSGIGIQEHLMPTAVLEAKKAKAAPAAKPKAEGSLLLKRLELLAKGNDLIGFQTKAMELEGLDQDQELLMSVLDDSDDGFWAKNH